MPCVTIYWTRSISIHAPRVGSDKNREKVKEAKAQISIHAPRVGSDAITFTHFKLRCISIHAPRVGSDK